MSRTSYIATATDRATGRVFRKVSGCPAMLRMWASQMSVGHDIVYTHKYSVYDEVLGNWGPWSEERPG